MKLSYEKIRLRMKETFRIARYSTDFSDQVVVYLDDGKYVGMGSATPSSYYGETVDTVIAVLEYVRPTLEQVSDPFDIERIEAEIERQIRRNGAAKAAIDMALNDLIGKHLSMPLYRLYGSSTTTPISSYTISIDTIEGIKRRVREAKDYPILKVKLGTEEDMEIIKTVRENSNAIIRVDANAAWQPKEAVEKIEQMKSLGIEFVEQPISPYDLDGLKYVYERSPLPIIVDESVEFPWDIGKISDRIDGINIKLMKCGGMRRAMEMIHVARAMNLKVMLGCMTENSVSIAAAAHLAGLVDYVDLDSTLFFVEEPFKGFSNDKGILRLSNEPGLGVNKV